jgi:hypothetical protein
MIKLILGFLKGIPVQVYIIFAIISVATFLHLSAISAAKNKIRNELEPQIATLKEQLKAANEAQVAAQTVADANARSLAKCIGTKMQMDVQTAKVLSERDTARLKAERALTQTRKELNDAYAKAADVCGGQPVPDDVLRLLDGTEEAQGGGNSSPQVRSRAEGSDTRDPAPSEARHYVPGTGHVGCLVSGCLAAVQ